MLNGELTLKLPLAIYEKVKITAQQTQRSMAEVASEWVTAIAGIVDKPEGQMRHEFSEMTFWNDAALWHAARATLSESQRDRLEALHEQQQNAPLTENEKAEADKLLRLYQDTIQVRAQATLLLKLRGYDVGNPEQFQPLA